MVPGACAGRAGGHNGLRAAAARATLPRLAATRGVRTFSTKASGDQTVEADDAVEIHYVGTLDNGDEFDASRPREQPLAFVVGRFACGALVALLCASSRGARVPRESTEAHCARGVGHCTHTWGLTLTVGRTGLLVRSGQMIPGMDKGVLGMKVGETKTIKCTPTEAYGEKSDDAMIRESRERVEGALGKEETKVGSKVMIGQSGFPSTIVEVTDTEVRALLLSLLLSHPSESESEKLKARAGE